MIESSRAEIEAEMLKMHVADTISSILEETKYNQADLARISERSEAQISKMLSGEGNMTLSSIARLAEALGARWLPLLTRIPDHPRQIDLPNRIRTERAIVDALRFRDQLTMTTSRTITVEHSLSFSPGAQLPDVHRDSETQWIADRGTAGGAVKDEWDSDRRTPVSGADASVEVVLR